MFKDVMVLMVLQLVVLLLLYGAGRFLFAVGRAVYGLVAFVVRHRRSIAAGTPRSGAELTQSLVRIAATVRRGAVRHANKLVGLTVACLVVFAAWDFVLAGGVWILRSIGGGLIILGRWIQE